MEKFDASLGLEYFVLGGEPLFQDHVRDESDHERDTHDSAAGLGRRAAARVLVNRGEAAGVSLPRLQPEYHTQRELEREPQALHWPRYGSTHQYCRKFLLFLLKHIRIGLKFWEHVQTHVRFLKIKFWAKAHNLRFIFGIKSAFFGIFSL